MLRRYEAEAARRGPNPYITDMERDRERERVREREQERRVNVDHLREKDRSRLRETDPFLASYVEKGRPPGTPLERPRVSKDLQDLYTKASTR